MFRKALIACFSVVAVLAILAVSSEVPAQDSTTATRYNIRYYYSKGPASLDTHPYTYAEAVEVAKAQMVRWNDLNPENRILNYEFVPYQVNGSPPPQQAGTIKEQLLHTRWVGWETLNSYGRLEFRFLPNNEVRMTDKKETWVKGYWSAAGNRVTMDFYGDKCKYEGKVQDKKMSGTCTTKNRKFTWKVWLDTGIP